jgi:hypothetical protein
MDYWISELGAPAHPTIQQSNNPSIHLSRSCLAFLSSTPKPYRAKNSPARASPFITMDFRTNAAELTFRRTQDSSGAALAQLNESGCLQISGGRRIHCLFEIPFVILTMSSLLASLAVIALSTVNVLSTLWAMGLSALLLIVGLVSRKIKSLMLYSFLRLRAGSLLRLLKELPAVDVGLEHAATYKQMKMVVEDEGVCLLDESQKRILMEGCSYRPRRQFHRTGFPIRPERRAIDLPDGRRDF